MSKAQWIKDAARKIMSDLDDRSLGLDSVDDEIREEIKEAIEDHILASFDSQ